MGGERNNLCVWDMLLWKCPLFICEDLGIILCFLKQVDSKKKLVTFSVFLFKYEATNMSACITAAALCSC